MQTDGVALTERLLDPFSFFPGIASRILGLGGNAPGYDHSYAFHTEYVEAAPGRAHFTLRFHGLAAKRGTLQLWVHMLPIESGANARVVNSERIQINRLVQLGGQHSIPFESFHGVSFAVHGAIVDETDAEADALIVALDRPADPNDRPAAAIEARSSSYGRAQTRPEVHLISTRAATLGHPVSQCATEAQVRDGSVASTLATIGLPAGSAMERWRLAYLVRTLQAYGMLQPGASGLGFEPGATAFGNALRRCGPDITMATTAEDAEGAIRIDPAAIPPQLVNFDFVWSNGVGAQLGSSRAMSNFVEQSVGCLRPGGLGIHLLPFDPNADRFAWPGGTGPFTRNRVEQLALAMILRGHEMAQIKIDKSDALRTSADADKLSLSEFGVIVRRAPSAL